MYEYKFIEVSIKGMFFGGDDHRKIIDERSKKGWRFVAAIPSSAGSYGQVSSVDLVFERCIEDSSIEK
ncbi:MAG: DUF4177 domain-containing protein [Paraclostridium sp.]